ncbi:MAG: hypothetical protein LBV23_09400 [Deltaproteobacteria bacterium]|nr:hypothetical protein [Deltaproteobacteria bacterium]
MRLYCLISLIILHNFGIRLQSAAIPAQSIFEFKVVSFIQCFLLSLCVLLLIYRPLTKLALATGRVPAQSSEGQEQQTDEANKLTHNLVRPLSLCRSWFKWLKYWPEITMIAIIFAQLLYLLSGLNFYLPSLNRWFKFFHPTLWGAFAALVFFSKRLLGEDGKFTFSLGASLILALNLSLTILGHDLYAARSEVAVAALWLAFFSKGSKSRLMGPLLVCFYAALEILIKKTSLYHLFEGLYWLNPLDRLTLAFDISLKEAAFYLSSWWGMGLNYLYFMGFPRPDLTYFNAWANISTTVGYGGVIIYGLVLLSLMACLLSLTLKKLTRPKALLILPAWLLICANQYYALALYLGWRVYGQTHPPAFIGGNETAMEILILTAFILWPSKSVDLIEPKKIEPAVVTSKAA